MNSGKNEEHESSAERWLVSYADLITLMFAFFTVLYATSEKDLSKANEFEESIKRYLIKAGAFGESGQKVQQGEKNNSVIEPPIPTFGEKSPDLAEVRDQAEVYLEKNLTKAQRERYISDLSSDEWGVRMVLPASVIFADNSDSIREEALPFLEVLSGLLSQTKRKIMVEGHVRTGEKGRTRSTWDLSSARAVNILRYVQLTKNVPAQQLASSAFGDSRPLTSSSQDLANSRIEIILLSVDREL